MVRTCLRFIMLIVVRREMGVRFVGVVMCRVVTIEMNVGERRAERAYLNRKSENTRKNTTRHTLILGRAEPASQASSVLQCRPRASGL